MKSKQIEQEWYRYRKWQKQNHMRQCSLDEFTRYVQGKGGLGQTTKRGNLRHRPSPHDERMAANRAIPSHTTNVDATCFRRENPVYSGDLVRGIATMHKSNAIPVVDDQHIIDIARMRR